MLLQAEQMQKMTTISLEIVEVAILLVAQFVRSVFFSQLESREPTDKNPTQI
jgi:hypothetical protein